MTGLDIAVIAMVTCTVVYFISIHDQGQLRTTQRGMAAIRFGLPVIAKCLLTDEI